MDDLKEAMVSPEEKAARVKLIEDERLKQKNIDDARLLAEQKEKEKQARISNIRNSISGDVKEQVAKWYNSQNFRYNQIGIKSLSEPYEDQNRWVVRVEFVLMIDAIVAQKYQSHSGKFFYNSAGQFQDREWTLVESTMDYSATKNAIKWLNE